jgi:hypothetical protein
MTTQLEFVKYILKEGDTLQSVAEELNIDIEYLMLIHNLNVEMYDKIKSRFEGFPKHLSSIYITEEIVRNLEKKSERKTGYVIWASAFYEKRKYGFSLENFKKEDLISKVHYEMELVYIKKKSEFNVIEINRKQLYINNSEPDTVLEQLADAIGQTIFPIQINRENNGKMHSIENHDEIVARWKTNKEKLSSYYKGEIAEKIMAKATVYFSNQYAILDSLANNWFFNLVFQPIYGSYTTQKQFQNTSFFPITATNLVAFETTQTLGDIYTKTNKIEVAIEAKAKDNSGSEASIHYKLNDTDNSIFSIIGTITAKDSTTQIEIYQQ